MCTDEGPAVVTVCDVAIGDVRSALEGSVPASFEHLPYEGTRVTAAAGVDPARFRDLVDRALRPHGGSLPGR